MSLDTSPEGIQNVLKMLERPGLNEVPLVVAQLIQALAEERDEMTVAHNRMCGAFAYAVGENISLAASIWEAVATLAAGGTSPEGIEQIARQNANELRKGEK